MQPIQYIQMTGAAKQHIMTAMLLRRHNLNLLPILRELLRSQNVSRTAEAVGLSQSAISAALARLREDFGDELLVMKGRRLELTEGGRRLIPQVESACIELESLLRPSAFLPDQETRRFVVATADYVSYLVAPALSRIFAAEAPRASVHFIDIGANLQSRLTTGELDLLAIPEDTAGDMRNNFNCAALFTDETVVISSTVNKAFSGPLTRKIFENSPHAMFQLAPKRSISHEMQLMIRAGIQHEDRVLVEHFLTLPAIVEATDCLALIQRRLAEQFQRSHAIEIHVPPFAAERMTISAFWSKSLERDPAHSWFRDAMFRAARVVNGASADR